MNIIFGIMESLVLAVLLPLSGWRLLHYFQLESYQLPGYYRSLKRNAKKALLPGLAMAAVGVLAAVLGLASVLRMALMALMAGWLFVQAKNEKLKKPFVVTERVKRLIAMHAATAFVVALVVRFALPLVLWCLLPAFEAALIALAAVCAQPIEKHINQQFVEEASGKESEPD